MAPLGSSGAASLTGRAPLCRQGNSATAGDSSQRAPTLSLRWSSSEALLPSSSLSSEGHSGGRDRAGTRGRRSAVSCRLRGSSNSSSRAGGSQPGGSPAATGTGGHIPGHKAPGSSSSTSGVLGAPSSPPAQQLAPASGAAVGSSAGSVAAGPVGSSPGSAHGGRRAGRGKGRQPGSASTATAAAPARASAAVAAAPRRPSAAPGRWTSGVSSVAMHQHQAAEQPDELDVFRGLVLDSSYRPINVVCWKRALCLEIADKADVLEYYDAVVRSTSQTFPIPAVLRVSGFVHTPKQSKRKLSLSRNNIFLRDKFRCQYCGSKENLTIDHVVALSRGGGSSWENLVTACSPCNLKKGDKSPAEAGMKLAKHPREPRELDCRDLPPNYKTFRSLARHRSTPPQWLDWLPIQPAHPFSA